MPRRHDTQPRCSALPGVAGLALMTVAGGVLGYRHPRGERGDHTRLERAKQRGIGNGSAHGITQYPWTTGANAARRVRYLPWRQPPSAAIRSLILDASSSSTGSSASTASMRSLRSPTPLAASFVDSFARPARCRGADPAWRRAVGRGGHQIVVPAAHTAERDDDRRGHPAAARGVGERVLKFAKTGEDHIRTVRELGIARIGEGVDRGGVHVHRRIGQTNDYWGFAIIRL